MYLGSLELEAIIIRYIFDSLLKQKIPCLAKFVDFLYLCCVRVLSGPCQCSAVSQGEGPDGTSGTPAGQGSEGTD